MNSQTEEKRKLSIKHKKTFNGNNEYVLSVAITKNGKFLACESDDYMICIWNTNNCKQIKKFSHKKFLDEIQIS